MMTRWVSIPYERESLSKDVSNPVQKEIAEGFNSLRTGKPIQRDLDATGDTPVDYVFQFPTNGKAYPKIFFRASSSAHRVQFQFPTNGKAYPKESEPDPDPDRGVSIPYERESLSKGILREIGRTSTQVSIPYERESLSKEKT